MFSSSTSFDMLEGNKLDYEYAIRHGNLVFGNFLVYNIFKRSVDQFSSALSYDIPNYKLAVIG